MLKKTIFLVLIILSSVVILEHKLLSEEKKDKPKNEPEIVYEFKSQDEIKGFVNAIQTKEMILNRINVLRQYLLEEQQKLDNLNAQLLYRYNINAEKNYSLDTEKGLILETEINQTSTQPENQDSK